VLISPRLMNVNNQSVISFYGMDPNGTGTYALELGFMTDPSNINTFTRLQYYGPNGSMELHTVNMDNYVPSMGRNFAIISRYRNVFIDDFNYTAGALSVENFQSDIVSLWPNPASDVFHVEAKKEMSGLAVYDLRGRLLFTNAASGTSAQIEVSGLSPGMYLLEVKMGSVSETRKFLKQ